MESVREQKTKELFKAALELPPEERGAFLDGACAGDEELRLAVEQLLAAAESTGISIETSAMKLAARELAEERKQDESRRQLAAGTLISHYRVLKPIGAGGMGMVYLAEDANLHRQVAIKFLAADSAANADRVRRFEQEALAISALRHPNIVTIHDTLRHEHLHLIVTEFVEGETLREIIAQSALDWREAARIAGQIASALAAAHAAGIIHRDIKPENVVRQVDGLVKVLDFGIAKHIKNIEQHEVRDDATEAALAHNYTKTGNIFGTVNYMSPEQARGEREIDARTDIFSLGVLLFELLTQRRPFPGETIEEKLEALLNEQEAPDVRKYCPNIPAALAALIAKAIRKDRAQRYATAGEMLSELQELRSQIDTTDLERVQQSLKTQSANRLFSQFTVLYLKDDRVRLPLSRLVMVWWASDLPRGKPERDLLRKSLRRGLLKLGGWSFALLLAAVAIAAMLSIDESWEDVRVFRDGHTAAARRAVFSPDGRWLVSVSEDKQVIVWDFARRMKQKVIRDHTDLVTALAFSPDGRWFATGSHDKTVIVWDAHSLEKLATLREHRDRVRALAFSPDSQMLVSVSSLEDRNEGQTIVWRTGEWRKVWEFSAGHVYGNLLFSSDSHLLMTPLGQWNLVTGQRVSWDEDWYQGNWAEFSPDKNLLVTIGGDAYFSSLARPADVATRELIHRERVHQDFGRAVAFSPDGKLVATGSDDIVVWETATRKIWARWDFDAVVWSLTFSPDGKWLVSAHSDGSILLWDIARMDRSASLNGHNKGVRAVAISPDQKRIASASEDRSVIVWNAASGRKEMVLKGHETRVIGVVFSPDGKWLASADQDGFLIRWDLERRQPKWKIKRLHGTVSLAISPAGHWLSLSRSVYDSEDGREVMDFSHLELKVGGEGVAFSADGRKLASVAVFGICVFDTGNWRIAAHRGADGPSLISVAFSPDGRKLATGDLAGKVMLWDAESLQPLATIGQHGARIKSIAFSPDGQSLISAGDDNRILLWDMSWRRDFSGGWLKRDAHVGTHAAPVLALAFSPDGRRIVSGEHDKSVRLYTRHRTLWGWRLD